MKFELNFKNWKKNQIEIILQKKILSKTFRYFSLK